MAVLRDLWASFQALPLWVRAWLALLLAPVNMASLAFAGEVGGATVAAMAWAGMVLNLPVMVRERGFSRAMAFAHLIGWVPLVAVIAVLLWAGVPGGAPAFAAYLWLLLAVDLISLLFDVRDAVLWWRGERAVPGRQAPAVSRQ